MVRDGWGVCQVGKEIIIKISKTSILLREISAYWSMVYSRIRELVNGGIFILAGKSKWKSFHTSRKK
jgi:hypothetical protein